MSHALDLSWTLPAGAERGQLLGLVTSQSRLTRWKGLPSGLDALLDSFERFQMGSVVARLKGADAAVVDGLQQARGEEVIHAVLGRLPPGLRTALQHRVDEDRGLLVLHHHVVRELAHRAHEASDVFAASGACQLATIGLETELRRLHASPESPRVLVEARDAVVSDLVRRVPTETLPLGGAALCLLWCASLARLGRQPLEDETTEHYAA